MVTVHHAPSSQHIRRHKKASSATNAKPNLYSNLVILLFFLLLVINMLMMMGLDNHLLDSETNQRLALLHRDLQAQGPVIPSSKPAESNLSSSNSPALTKGTGSIHFKLKSNNQRDTKKMCDSLMGTLMEDEFWICDPNFSPNVSRNDNKSQIKCQWNPLLQSSFCEANNFVIDTTKVIVAKGGEDIQLVQGRIEEEELPKYQTGAFSVFQCQLQLDELSQQSLPYHVETILKQLEIIQDGSVQSTTPCDAFIERPALFVTRYEYANLYHTYTDWYSAYQAAMVAFGGDKVLMETLDIFFLDGHAKTTVDEGWKLLFPKANIQFVGSLSKAKHCYRHAILVPAGYRAPISIDALEDSRQSPMTCVYVYGCGETTWQADFRARMVQHSLMQLESQNEQWRYRELAEWMSTTVRRELFPVPAATSTSATAINATNSKSSLRILLVSRQDYYSHPRMDGRVTRKIANERDLMAFVESGVSQMEFRNKLHVDSIEINRIVLEEHTVSEQILMFEQADIVVGMHGAGLTHILVARPGTLLIELKPPGFTAQKHFEYMARLAGCLYKAHILNVPRPPDRFIPYTIPISDFAKALEKGIEMFLDHRQKKKLFLKRVLG